MRKGVTAFFVYLITSLIGITPVVVSSVVFRNNYVYQNAELDFLDSFLTHNNSSYTFVNFSLNGKNSYNTSQSIYLNRYPYNFNKDKSQTILTVSKKGLPVKYDVSTSDGVTLPFNTSLVSGVNYTNNQSLIRFETNCINLYCFRPKNEELSFDSSKYDGFIYIPDYFADYIIESNPNIKTYDDIIYSENINFAIKIKNNNNEFKYKVANIFRINDFNKDYSLPEHNFSYNDGSTGKLLNYFFNGFCFVSNFGHLADGNSEYSFSNILMAEPKKYVLKEFLDVSCYFAKNNTDLMSSLNIFSKTSKSDQLIHYSNTHDLIQTFYGNTTTNTVVLSISIILFSIFIEVVFSFYLLHRFVENDTRFRIIFSSGCMVFLLFSFFIRKFCYYTSPSILLYFNEVSNIVTLIILFVLLLPMIIKIIRSFLHE